MITTETIQTWRLHLNDIRRELENVEGAEENATIIAQLRQIVAEMASHEDAAPTPACPDCGGALTAIVELRTIK